VEQYQFYEKGERECFSLLSNAVRDSHEKERAQAEKTKYWSILGSILGTCIGILGTTINNRSVFQATTRNYRDSVTRLGWLQSFPTDRSEEVRFAGAYFKGFLTECLCLNSRQHAWAGFLYYTVHNGRMTRKKSTSTIESLQKLSSPAVGPCDRKVHFILSSLHRKYANLVVLFVFNNFFLKTKLQSYSCLFRRCV
jgi:hypothetical protein